MKKLIVLMLLVVVSYAKMEFSDPQPSFDEPRKWMIKMNFNDKERVKHTLGAIYNVLKEYPQESIKISVVTYAYGMRVLKKDYDKELSSKVQSLMEYDVEFVACKNTMATMNWTKDDFIDDLTYVQTGLAEVIERKVAGWIEATPY
jgi:intracellular sulfur oxidation DsrE/DsrF family protein